LGIVESKRDNGDIPGKLPDFLLQFNSRAAELEKVLHVDIRKRYHIVSIPAISCYSTVIMI
jgi:hypothetical protein